MRISDWSSDVCSSDLLDLLGFGDPSEAAMLATFRDILAQDAEDGVVFDPDTLRVDRIREELDYGGLRLRAIASVGGARINLTIDIGFGDALEDRKSTRMNSSH